MSIDFFAIRDDRSGIDRRHPILNLANINALDLVRWLALEEISGDLRCGEISANELAARCRRRLWDVSRNHDPERPRQIIENSGHAKLIVGGRSPDYLRSRTAELLQLAEAVGDGAVAWG